MSWPMVKLSDFCHTTSGGTPSRLNDEFYDGDIPWIKSGDLRENIITEASEYITDLALQKSSAKLIPAGAILLAMYGATVGRMAILGIEAATNQAVCSIIPDPKIAFVKYVYYALQHKVPDFLQNAVGGAQPNINQGIIKETKIPLPPLEEQKRIAAILDKADAIRQKRQKAIELADEFLRSVFLDMFGDPVTNPKEWKTKVLSDIFQLSSGKGLTSKQMNNEGEFKVYGGNGIAGYHDEYMFEEPKLTIGRVGVYCGCIHITEPRSWITDNSLYVKKYHLTVNVHYLAQLLKMSNLNQYAGVAAQPLISGNRIYPLEVIFPPIELQNKFEENKNRVKYLFSNVSFSTKEMNILFDALTKKAFSGEL